MTPGGARDRKDRGDDSKLLNNCRNCGHPEIEHDSVTGRCGHVNRSSTSITLCMCSSYMPGEKNEKSKKLMSYTRWSRNFRKLSALR
jgi:hypothetical protein